MYKQCHLLDEAIWEVFLLGSLPSHCEQKQAPFRHVNPEHSGHHFAQFMGFEQIGSAAKKKVRKSKKNSSNATL